MASALNADIICGPFILLWLFSADNQPTKTKENEVQNAKKSC